MGEWQVETKMRHGWENVWSVFCDDIFGNVTDKLMTFETEHEAQQELDYHLEIEAEAYANGDAGYAPELSEYRISKTRSSSD